LHIIGGKFKKRTLVAPKSEKVRPTTSQLREALFNICQNEIQDARFLDLFAGSGAMGLEALSRGAAHVTFVEKNRFALAAIRKNISQLAVEDLSEVLGLDAFKALDSLATAGRSFELIYADPPYGEGFGERILCFLDTHSLLSHTGSLFLEEESLHLPSLKTLKMYDQRKIGRAHLYEFRT
jgi:16S rRNA (guanine(966)-N(2))-methyltransferase RsmD